MSVVSCLPMSNFLQRLFHRDFGPPPPPDLTLQPTISGQSIVELIYSDSKQQRAIITRDGSGIYRIHLQWWDTSDWKAWAEAFWAGGGSSSFTDKIETARTLARDALNELPQREA
jgi:hypothetical protein